MPFYSSAQPSIQIGLLHSIAERAGFSVDSFHLNLDFASRLSQRFYEMIAAHGGHLTGEWIFSKAAFGKDSVPAEVYFSKFPKELRSDQKRKATALFKRIQEFEAPRFLSDCIRTVNWDRYDLIGFSSTFQQNVASLALARRIKKKFPEVKILFGGANMEGEMGQECLRAFPFIDFVATGEGDLLFPELLRTLEKGAPASAGIGIPRALARDLDGIPGLAFRLNTEIRSSGPAPLFRDMDSLPTPNYDEYFERFERLNLHRNLSAIFLPVETARGCWWGEKHHCTFCGLNGMNMGFRAKSADRVRSELEELSTKYGSNRFSVTDNILDLKFFHSLFSNGQTKKDYQFAWEIKANLSREQLHQLYRGGMRQLQPGIESLSTHVLQLMRKGCSMLQNLVTLKWSLYYRIDAIWNLLYGFPGETEEDYEKEFHIVKLISHLAPPMECNRIWLERYAPYFFDRKTFPVSQVRPEASYSLVYPSHVELERLAYFFDYQMGNTVAEEFHKDRKKWVNQWQDNWESRDSDSLTFEFAKGKFWIHDKRTLPGRNKSDSFSILEGKIYEICSDTFHSIRYVQQELLQADQDVGETLNSFCELGYMVSEDGKYLALGIPM
jgi:ribosomal peptide maturation radical SAM protein 1